MSASDNIQWGQHMSSYMSPEAKWDAEDSVQLKMFERAGVLAASPASEKSPNRSKGDFVARKLEESHRQAFFPHESPSVRSLLPEERGVVNTTYESVQKYGVRNPVLVRQTGNNSYVLEHGYHRVYSANDIDPDMLVPLAHYSSKEDRRSASRASMGFEGWHDPTTPRPRN